MEAVLTIGSGVGILICVFILILRQMKKEGVFAEEDNVRHEETAE